MAIEIAARITVDKEVRFGKPVNKGTRVPVSLPRSTAGKLIEAGHTAEHASDLGLGTASDREIFDRAQRTKAVLITRDLDFTNPLKFPETSHHGLLIVRIREILPPVFVSMTALPPRRASSRLVGYSILTIGITLAAGGLWLGSWSVILCVFFAMAVIGAGFALQLACRLAVGACLTFLALGMAIASTAGRRLISRPTFR